MTRVSFLGQQAALWFRYTFEMGGLAVLLLPRSALWARRWARARVDQRLLLARAVGATATSA